MRRRQGAADGHLARARAELRQGLRHQVPVRRRPAGATSGRPRGAVSTRMVGGLIMAHGDDNGLRVPPRLAPTQVAGDRRQGRRGVSRPRPRLARRAERRGRPGRAGRPGRHPVRPPGGRLRSSRASRSGSRSARATWPTAAVVAGPPDRRRARRRSPLAGAASTRSAVALVEDQARCTTRRRRRRDGATRRRERRSRTRSRPRRPAGPGCRGRSCGPEGEARLAERAVTVRCLVRAGRLAARDRRRAGPARLLRAGSLLTAPGRRRTVRSSRGEPTAARQHHGARGDRGRAASSESTMSWLAGSGMMGD